MRVSPGEAQPLSDWEEGGKLKLLTAGLFACIELMIINMFSWHSFRVHLNSTVFILVLDS